MPGQSIKPQQAGPRCLAHKGSFSWGGALKLAFLHIPSWAGAWGAIRWQPPISLLFPEVFSDGKGEKGPCEARKPIPLSWVNKDNVVHRGPWGVAGRPVPRREERKGKPPLLLSGGGGCSVCRAKGCPSRDPRRRASVSPAVQCQVRPCRPAGPSPFHRCSPPRCVAQIQKRRGGASGPEAHAAPPPRHCQEQQHSLPL